MSFFDIAQGSVSGISGILVYHTTLDITIGGIDVTKLFPAINTISLHYEDVIAFQADTLEIICPDIHDQLIKSKWLKKGIKLNVNIHVWNADYPGSHVVIRCGDFEIDVIEQVGPPTQLRISATSIPISGQLKLTWVYQIWPGISIKDIASQVAARNHIGFVWDAPNTKNVPMESFTQNYEADLTMVSRLCREHGLAMAVKDGKMIIFDEQMYETKPAVYTLNFTNPTVIKLVRWKLTTKSQDIYNQAQYLEYNPNTAQLTGAAVGVPDDNTTGTKELVTKLGSMSDPTTSGEAGTGGDLGEGD